jgi:enoyl-CoA hydratase/carnithine racemase
MSKYAGRWQTEQVEVEHGIGWITLNRPEKRNNTPMPKGRLRDEIIELAHALSSARANSGVLRWSLPIC